MNLTQKTLKNLEFDKITTALADLCSTDGARAMALSLMPSSDFSDIIKRRDKGFDAYRLINAKGYPSFYANESVPAAAERAYKGAVLSMRELLNVSSLLRSARVTVDYISADKPFETSLDEIFSRLVINRALEEKINRSIISEELIADEASPLLLDIRRKIRNTNNKIKETLSGFIGGERIKYLQENIVTMRNGRYVVPVKAEYKNEFKGLVHDTSSSGATLFIEPMSVVDANNELKTLSALEEHEIERILAELSSEVAEASGAICVDYQVLTELSYYYAVATLAINMKASPPVIVKERVIDLKRARHPLISKERVVPIDVSVGRGFNTLIITGPNTGGKTVTLKTIGLLTLMASSGLMIPAEENSVIGVFESVLVDIGDEQSIEASLSTFSSHMVNIVNILSSMSDKSLVLFDELGSGTDPIEGAALATAILEKTKETGALCAATTHYSELKVYALETPGVQNASCEFDIETLRPTYKLIVGAPGKSNAFRISEKLGISPDIIDRATELIERDNKRFEDVIEKLDTNRIEMEKEREKASALRLEFENFKRTAEEDLKKKLAKSEEEIQKQTLKARQILDSARASSEFVFKQLEEIRKLEDKEKRAEFMKRAREEIRNTLNSTETLFEGFDYSEVSLDDDYKLPRELKISDKVYLVKLHQEGTVTALKDKKGYYEVTAGILKAKALENELRLIEGNAKFRAPAPKKTVSEGKVKKNLATASFKCEVDVRGMIGDDAWFVVDKYLDDAVLASVPFVRIIHGKGTGALRAALWKYFKNDKRIKSYRHGNYGEGDSGVTVIEFKQ